MAGSSSARRSPALIVAMLLGAAWPLPAMTPPAPSKPLLPTREPRPIEWSSLLPDRERLAFQIELPAPPQPPHAYLDESGPPAKQTGSALTNPALDGMAVQLSGFVVPLTTGKRGIVTEFLLVPYYGACIHVPPPPPNQTLYVRFPRGFKLKSLYEPYETTGVIHTRTKSTDLASAAYTLEAYKVELYGY